MGLTKELKIPEELFELAKKEFEVGWQDDTVVIRRLKYGDNLQIQKQAMKITGTPGAVASTTADINPKEFQATTVLKGTVKAPWGAGNLPAILDLPPFIGEWVKDEIEKFNKLKSIKKSNSTNSPGGLEPQTGK